MTQFIQRWGTFSVRDHLAEAPFVSEVLMYDHLVVPVLNPNDAAVRQWHPERQAKCLEILKVKTDDEDGLALGVPWDSDKRAYFSNQMSTAAALSAQGRDAGATYYMDPFQMTRNLMAGAFKPTLPKGVSKAWAVAAYPSIQAYEADVARGSGGPKIPLGLAIRHRFLMPVGPDPQHERLKRAVDLATTDSYQRRRAAFYELQQELVEEEIPADKALEQLDIRLKEYNQATEEAFKDVVGKYVFTVVPIGVAMTGALIGGTTAGLVLAAASGLVQLTRFVIFDRKPKVANGDLDAAAMIHDAQEVLRS
jgi:hypothetical protein